MLNPSMREKSFASWGVRILVVVCASIRWRAQMIEIRRVDKNIYVETQAGKVIKIRIFQFRE
jgi:hypothetical protein